MLLSITQAVPVFGEDVSVVVPAPLSHWTAEGDAGRSTATRLFARFCDDVSIDVRAASESLRKMLVVSQKNVNVRVAFAECFGLEAFIDWDRVESMWRDRPYQDSLAWVQLMGFVREVGGWERELLREHPVLLHFDECVRLSGLGDNSAWQSVALYLLVSVRQLHTLHAVELFYSTHFKRGVRSEALVFFSEMANKQFDRESQTRALVAVLKRCVGARGQELALELELMRTQALEMDMLFKQKMVRAAESRPRLRSRLRVAVDRQGSLFDMDQLERWTGFIRFPNVFSMKQRKRLYFVMAQCHVVQSEFMAHLLPDRELCATVLNYPVKQPDVDVIHQCVADLRVVSDPFPELHLFRARCFDSFAQEHKSRLRLNDLLQLYVAAYQAPAIWKNVWKLVFPVLSIQIIRDVEAFVEKVPFAAQSVLAIMFELPLFVAAALPLLLDPAHDDRIAGEGDDALDPVRDTEDARGEGVEQRAHEPAPLEHQMLRPVEPAVVDLGVSLEGADPALAHPSEPQHVVHEDARDPLFHEEPPAEGGARGAGGGEGALGVGSKAHVD